MLPPILQCCLFCNVAFSPMLPFLQENWFHDCDNEHAKITAFFQVIRKGMRIITIKLPFTSRRRERRQFVDLSLSRFADLRFLIVFVLLIIFTRPIWLVLQDELSKAHASTENRQVELTDDLSEDRPDLINYMRILPGRWTTSFWRRPSPSSTWAWSWPRTMWSTTCKDSKRSWRSLTRTWTARSPPHNWSNSPHSTSDLQIKMSRTVPSGKRRSCLSLNWRNPKTLTRCSFRYKYSMIFLRKPLQYFLWGWGKLFLQSNA